MKAPKSIIRRWPVFACICLMSSLLQAEDRLSEQQVAFFEKSIRPVLAKHCYECHSERAEKLKGGLRLDLSETLRRGGDSGPAISPLDFFQTRAARQVELLQKPDSASFMRRIPNSI